jgi:hypothetical protein
MTEDVPVAKVPCFFLTFATGSRPLTRKEYEMEPTSSTRRRVINGRQNEPLSPHSKRLTDQKCYGFGGHLRIPLIWYQIMSREEAQVLEFLWNLRDCLESSDQLEDDEWFYCTNRRLQQALGLSRKVQCRIFNRLEDLKFVKRNLRGIPAKRYVRVFRQRIINSMRRQQCPWMYE